MSVRQLNIRSDEAYSRASGIAKHLGTTTTQVVEEALRVYEDQVQPRDEQGFTPEQRRRYDILTAAAAEARRRMIPGADFDGSWMYDENGLPK